MPNEVYVMTHTALSALVSHRAATRVLDAALASTNHTSDTVTVRGMRKLLAHSVRRELSGTLPGPGLTRSLRQIADDLYRLQPSHTTQVQRIDPEEHEAIERLIAGADSQAAPLGREGSVRRPVETSVAGPAEGVVSKPLPFVNEAGFAHKGAPQIASRLSTAELTPPLELTETVMTSSLQLFGELETVDQVVVVRGSEVVLERGSGVPTRALPNLIMSTKHLLARAGRLKLYALERREGTMFVFPIGSGAVVVVTKPNVNLGAVLAARAALEEAA